MEWVEKLNQCMVYIEENLTREIDPERLGRLACCSSYHFQRMFTYMAGVTLSEYIRRRKMSLAAEDLLGGEEKIIDLALKYGYASPTAFTRAFESIHGASPSAVRSEALSVKSFPPIKFSISVQGGYEMDYRIENRPAFRVVGISTPLEREIEKNFMSVPQLWQRAASDGTIERLAQLMDTPPMGLLGVSACGNEEQWRYFVAVSTTQPAEGFEEYTVPACTWAVFPGEGTNRSIQELERRVVTEWLPGSGYEYADAPDVEVYLNADPENAKFEVWIPVVKK